MKMVKRGRFEIAAQILRFCVNPQTIGRIASKVRMSGTASKRYLFLLQARGLLELQDNSNSYITTEKGHEFVEKWRALKQMINRTKITL